MPTTDAPLSFEPITARLLISRFLEPQYATFDCGNVTNADGSLTTDPVIVLFERSYSANPYPHFSSLRSAQAKLNIVGHVVTEQVLAWMEQAVAGFTKDELTTLPGVRYVGPILPAAMTISVVPTFFSMNFAFLLLCCSCLILV
jgi:hypothetical protein